MRILLFVLLSLVVVASNGFSLKKNVATKIGCKKNVYWSETNRLNCVVETPKRGISELKLSGTIPILSNINFFRQPARKLLSLIFKVVSVLSIVFQTNVFKAGAVTAAAAAGVNGWDLYGRMPHDDWLFSNWILTDPDLLKRSFVETVRDFKVPL